MHVEGIMFRSQQNRNSTQFGGKNQVDSKYQFLQWFTLHGSYKENIVDRKFANSLV